MRTMIQKPMTRIGGAGLMWGIALGMVAGVLGGCADDDGDKTGGLENLPEMVTATHALQKMESCEELVAYAKEAAFQRMVAEAAATSYDEMCNYRGYVGGDWDLAMDDSAGGMEADGEGAPPPSASSDNGSDKSQGDESGISDFETNVQEEGVDEPDLIKSDGAYLYSLSDGDLVVVAVGENGTMIETGRIAVTGYPRDIFLRGDVAVVFSELRGAEVPEGIAMPVPAWEETGATEPSTPKPDIDYDGYSYDPNTYSRVALVDVSDRAHPSVLRTIDYAGRYVTSRRIAGSLRIVLSTRIPSLEISAYLDPYAFCELPAGEAVYHAAMDALIEENAKLIESATRDHILPKKLDSAVGAPEEMAACSEIYGPKTPAGTGLLTVVTLDLDQPKARQTDIAAFGEEGIVYASEDALYLTSAGAYVSWAWRAGMWSDPTSGIHKFDIASDPTKAIYKATGEVEGRMLNQFCMGEHDGYLRVATTTGTWDWSSWSNQVSVFAEQGGALVEVGKVAGFGAEEEIYGARFIGDRGFVVTFRQTDPLFTFDLSDPTRPRLVGEWVGPGYSSYLHPFGENHVIAVGMEDWRVALSLYDMSDFADPTMVERIYMGNDTSERTSAAVYDHKAFSFVQTAADQGLLSMPYNGYGYDEEYNYDTGIALYDVSLAGFEAAGEMSLFMDRGSSESYESEATRSVIIDNVLYGISNCRITSAPLDNPSARLATLPLFTGDYCGNGEKVYYDDEVGVEEPMPDDEVGVSDGAAVPPSSPPEEPDAVDGGVAND